jgi:hypothetical protein
MKRLTGPRSRSNQLTWQLPAPKVIDVAPAPRKPAFMDRVRRTPTTLMAFAFYGGFVLPMLLIFGTMLALAARAPGPDGLAHLMRDTLTELDRPDRPLRLPSRPTTVPTIL